jgi:branched-chain amino acid transport system permease protein
VFRLLGCAHIGRAWRALSTRQDISASLGIDVPKYKLIALVIAAVMATLAGALYVAFTLFVGPDLYDIAQVINLMFMLFVGGLRSTVGPIVGAAFVILVPQAVGGFERYQNLVFFGLLLLVILLRPAGAFGRARGQRSLASMLPGWMLRER